MKIKRGDLAGRDGKLRTSKITKMCSDFFPRDDRRDERVKLVSVSYADLGVLEKDLAKAHLGEPLKTRVLAGLQSVATFSQPMDDNECARMWVHLAGTASVFLGDGV